MIFSIIILPFSFKYTQHYYLLSFLTIVQQIFIGAPVCTVLGTEDRMLKGTGIWSLSSERFQFSFVLAILVLPFPLPYSGISWAREKKSTFSFPSQPVFHLKTWPWLLLILHTSLFFLHSQNLPLGLYARPFPNSRMSSPLPSVSKTLIHPSRSRP